MAFSKVYSGAVIGLEPHLVEVEVNIDYQGFPGFTIVGLPSKEVDEAKERVRSAIKNSGYQFPPRRITINLAPADIPKRGSLYDLPIAIGILAASGTLNQDALEKKLSDYMIIGELSLNGEVNGVKGVLPLTLLAKDNFKYIVVPSASAVEAAIVDKIKVKPVLKLSDLVKYLSGFLDIRTKPHSSIKDYSRLSDISIQNKHVDFKFIKGQENAKRAMEIAAAGGHNISLTGPPGSGKSLLSNALVSILPKLTEEEALETTNIYSIAGETINGPVFVVDKPFRAPHHSTSKAGLLGGGNPITPGEISYAHNGVLFLDEFPEFRREHIESLRLPIESRLITITRASGSITFPCRFMLVVSSNPCPCGNLGHPSKECTCSDHRIKYYREKMSGPIFDRIDLHVNCKPVDLKSLSSSKKAEDSLSIKKRVSLAQEIQKNRYKNNLRIKLNSDLTADSIDKYCNLSPAEKEYLEKVGLRFNLSARAYHKLVKVAQTIADLEGDIKIKQEYLAEAVQYRFN